MSGGERHVFAPYLGLRERIIRRRYEKEMKRLFDVGTKTANETAMTLGLTSGFDPNAPGVASIFSGLAAMIIAAKGD